MTDDAELLGKYARENSQSAFAELVRRRIGLVYGVALRRTCDPHLAEDVTQAVFSALARKAGRLAFRPALVGWLYRSAQFAASDAMRAERRRRTKEREATMMHEIDRKLSGPNWAEIRPMIDETVGVLGERDRDAILLRFLDGLTFAEVGSRLRLTENAARMRVERALGKMRARLQRRGVTSSAAAVAAAIADRAGANPPIELGADVARAALASAVSTGGAATSLTFLKLMSTTKAGIGLAAVTLMLSLGSAFYEARESEKSRAALARVTADRDALRANLAQAKQSSNLSRGTHLPAKAIPSGRAAHAWGTSSSINFVFEHPDTKSAFVQERVKRIMRKFDRFFASEHVSGAQQEAIEKQLSQLGDDMVDFDGLLDGQGFGPLNPPQDSLVMAEILKMESDIRAGSMNNIRAILGDDVYQSMVNFQSQLPYTNVTDDLAGRLRQSDAALSEGQVAQLAQIIRANPYLAGSVSSPANTLGGTFIPANAAHIISNLDDVVLYNISWETPISDAALSEATSVLSPEQMTSLRQIQAEEAARMLSAPQQPPEPTTAQVVEAYRTAHKGL